MKNTKNKELKLTNIATYEDLKQVLNDKKSCQEFGIMRVALTPIDARDILTNYDGPNRKTSPSVSRTYGKDMNEGLWEEETCATIGFDKMANMNDGRHRIFGFSKCDDDMTIVFTVVVGCERSMLTDTNKHRTPSDNARCCNLIPKNDDDYYSKCILQAINTLGSFNKKTTTSAKALYIESVIETNNDVIKSFQKGIDVQKCKKFRKAPILTAALNLYALGVIDNDDVKHIAYAFDNAFVPENGLTSRDNPIIELRRISDVYRNGEMGKRNLFALATKAFIAYKKGTKTKISMPQTATSYEIPKLYDFTTPKKSKITRVSKTKNKKLA